LQPEGSLPRQTKVLVKALPTMPRRLCWTELPLVSRASLTKVWLEPEPELLVFRLVA
jgi:hypothetical protein